MSIPLNVNILHHRRPGSLQLTASLMKGIKEENKKKFQVTIRCVDEDVTEYNLEDYRKIFEKNGINSVVSPVTVGPKGNYMSKVQAAVKSGSPYSVKLDDDCFLSSHTWDYVIENLSVLDSDGVMAITPTVTNGLPLVDDFISDFFSEEDKKKIQGIFLRTKIPDIWGIGYSWLSKHTIEQSEWVPSNFYKDVAATPHAYKGIHPVRVSTEAQDFLRDYVLANISRLFEKHSYRLEEVTGPYLCNSVFFIRTDRWKAVSESKKYFVDAFDEVPFNRYWKNNNLKLLRVKNGIAVHMYYNTLNHFGVDTKKRMSEAYTALERKFI